MAATVAVLGILAACGPSASRQEAADVLAQVMEGHRASIAGIGAPSGAAGARAAPRTAARAAPLADGPPRAVPDAPARRGGPAPASAAALVGQGPDGLLSALGAPALRRADGDAEVWLYLGPHCALDLVLYRVGGAPRVAHAAARANGAETRTESACLREVAGRA